METQLMPKPWRSGIPKLKWYDTAKPLVIQLLEKLNIPPITWRKDFSQYEVNQYIMKAADDRNNPTPTYTQHSLRATQLA